MDQEATKVFCERVCGLVATFAVFLERLEHDPVEVGPQGLPRRNGALLVLSELPQSRARTRRFRLGAGLPHRRRTAAAQLRRRERQLADEQFVEHHAEREDVCARVDVGVAAIRLLGGHVFGRADHLACFREQRGFDELLAERLGEAEVDDLDARRRGVAADEHVGRLEVAVHDALVVRVLHCVADLSHQRKARFEAQCMRFAERRQRPAFDELHDEVRLSALARAAVVDLGDAVVLHARERLTLLLEARDDRLAVHAELDELERRLDAHGRRALDAIDGAHAALAKHAEHAPRPDRFWVVASRQRAQRVHGPADLRLSLRVLFTPRVDARSGRQLAARMEAREFVLDDLGQLRVWLSVVFRHGQRCVAMAAARTARSGLPSDVCLACRDTRRD